MARMEIQMKVEIELNEDDRKLLQRFMEAVESMRPPTIEFKQPNIPDFRVDEAVWRLMQNENNRP